MQPINALRAIKNSLCSVTVSGEQNLSNLLGCIQLIDKLADQLSKDEERNAREMKSMKEELSFLRDQLEKSGVPVAEEDIYAGKAEP